MKKRSLFNTPGLPVLSFLLLIILLVQVGCKKTVDTSTNIPTKFTDLVIDPSFQFDCFISLDVTVDISNPGTQMLSLIELFQGDPNTGGKLISTGSVGVNTQYKTTIRIPSSLKELWIGKISATGINEYISAPITGKSLSYTFGKSINKSSDDFLSNDCNTGTHIVSNGSYTVSSGQTYVVQPGINITNLGLTINEGGTVRICGTANITSLNGVGTLIISPSGVVTIPVEEINGTINNYGSANFAQSGNEKKVSIEDGGTLHNWGTLTMSNSLQVHGTLINEYHLTIVEKAQTMENGKIINSCQMFVNSNSNDAFTITSGSASNPGLMNNPNAYLKVTGNTNFTGQGHVSLGLQSLIETGTFQVEGYIIGPVSQGSQIHALGATSSQVSNGNLSGYIDFWATSINPKNGTFGSHVTWHNPGYTIPAQNCSAPSVPVITSGLTAAGIVGIPITPYVITATGNDPIIFNATSLPAGLTYTASTHTISGTPTTAQIKNVTLTADNLVGTDTKTLVFTITGPGSAPVITSALTVHTPVSQSFTYPIVASGTGTITYNATNLPSGLTFNTSTHEINGSPASAVTFNIQLSATNTYGTDNKTLSLTVGTPPSIISPLTASGTTGQQFLTYTVSATGSTPITYNATNLPGGLNFSQENHTINGTPSQANVVNVTLTASNEYGNDSKILVITIINPVAPPVINSPLVATGMKNQPFNYALTATGSNPIVYNAPNLPAGLSFDAQYNVINGIPSQTGTFNIALSASNSAGTDTKTLSLTVAPPAAIDTDGDGVPDVLDAFPNDATRAFKSYYPNEVDYGSYAFEDLWPASGDYDCNDLVMNFKYTIVTNAQNKVVDLIAKFRVKSSGASYDNGFGLALNTSPLNVESVTGCIKVGSVVNIDPKGYEAGHTTNTVIIPIDAINTLLGHSLINTIHGGYTVQTEVHTVVVHLSNPQSSIGTPPYNPFIFVNQDRGKEIHLKDHAPTELANPVYFGSLNDASNAAQGYYYRSSTGLPWGLEIPVDFEYPVEKADIVQTYLHFAEWAQSSGATYSDWYSNKTGYKNASNVY